MTTPRRSLRLAEKAKINYYEPKISINWRYHERSAHTNGRLRHKFRFTRYSRKGYTFSDEFHAPRYVKKAPLPPFPRSKVLTALYKILECIFADECDGEQRVCYLKDALKYATEIRRLESDVAHVFKTKAWDREFRLFASPSNNDWIYVSADRAEDDTDGILEELDDMIGEALEDEE